jgi:hypothetical protein
MWFFVIVFGKAFGKPCKLVDAERLAAEPLVKA